MTPAQNIAAWVPSLALVVVLLSLWKACDVRDCRDHCNVLKGRSVMQGPKCWCVWDEEDGGGKRRAW